MKKETNKKGSENKLELKKSTVLKFQEMKNVKGGIDPDGNMTCPDPKLSKMGTVVLP